jgi:hypothetical protein
LPVSLQLLPEEINSCYLSIGNSASPRRKKKKRGGNPLGIFLAYLTVQNGGSDPEANTSR